MTATVIQTRYAGCHFRSRLEARWAVFFDAMSIPWQYEPEGFELQSGRYLPDFFLPSISAWFEVKGTRPTGREFRLLCELDEATGQAAFLAWGDLPDNPDHCGYDANSAPGDAGHRGMVARGDYDYAWCRCPQCGHPGIAYEGRGARAHVGSVCPKSADARCVFPGVSAGHGDKNYNADDPKLLAAYTAARSARFEYGETPR